MKYCLPFVLLMCICHCQEYATHLGINNILFWCDFNQICIFWINLRVSLRYKISRKSVRSEPRWYVRTDGRTYGRTDGRTDVTKLISAFRYCANAPKNIGQCTGTLFYLTSMICHFLMVSLSPEMQPTLRPAHTHYITASLSALQVSWVGHEPR
jgi:hypothetical protein